MPEMANSSLLQLLSSAPARNASARERSPVDAGAQNDAFSRTLDQKMKAPERPVDRSAERAAARRSATPEPTRSAHAPARPAAPAEARQNTAPAKPKDTEAGESTDAAASAQSTSDTAATATASTSSAAAATDTESELTTASGDPANTAPTANPAAALAATPAALAAATASAAEATPGMDIDTADQPTQARAPRGDMSQLAGNPGQARTAANTAEASTGLTAAQTDETPTTAPAAQSRPGRFAELLAANTAARGNRVGAFSAESPSVPGTTGNAALNAAMGGVHVPAADRPQATQGALPIHVGTPASDATWGDAVGNRVLWLVGQNSSKAELILTPPHLGKLEISLTVTGDTTTAQFTAATPAAREALEQAMPRLREMLEQAGVTLTDSNVNTTARDSNGETGHGQGRAGNTRGIETTQENLMSRSGPWLQRGEGMIDTFA